MPSGRSRLRRNPAGLEESYSIEAMSLPSCPNCPTSLFTSRPSAGGSSANRSRTCESTLPVLARETFDPPVESTFGKKVREIRRVGKRIAIGLDDDLWIVLHLMIAGRLAWKTRGAKLAGKVSLAAFDFETGSLVLTEAGTKRRASLHVLHGEESLRSQDPGGLEPLEATLKQFDAVLRRQNHTLKRALTDPRLFSGIGNAYSDEILHRARTVAWRPPQKLGPDRSPSGTSPRRVRSSWNGPTVFEPRPVMAFLRR